MRTRLRTKKLIIAGCIGASIVALIAVIVFYSIFTSMKAEEEKKVRKYEKEISELKTWTKQQERGLVINQEIEAGTVITEYMLEEVLLPERSAAKDLATEQQAVGRIAKVNLSENTLLTKSILFENEATPDDLRAAEYSFILLQSKLSADDFVDIRIQFPNGNDYILLSKKKVNNIEDKTVWLNLNEEEILSMSSAMVDAYLENAIIYSLSYVEPYTQEASIVTYPIKQNVLDLILKSPNIVNVAREQLEARDRGFLETQLEKISEEEKIKFNELIQKQEEQKEQQQQQKQQLENSKNDSNQEAGEKQEDVFTETIGEK